MHLMVAPEGAGSASHRYHQMGSDVQSDEDTQAPEGSERVCYSQAEIFWEEQGLNKGRGQWLRGSSG